MSDTDTSHSKFRSENAHASRRDRLNALKAHPIFETAAQRPLMPEEVDVYLSVKSKVAAFSNSEEPMQLRPGVRPPSGRGQNNALPLRPGESPFDLG